MLFQSCLDKKVEKSKCHLNKSSGLYNTGNYSFELKGFFKKKKKIQMERQRLSMDNLRHFSLNAGLYIHSDEVQIKAMTKKVCELCLNNYFAVLH